MKKLGWSIFRRWKKLIEFEQSISHVLKYHQFFGESDEAVALIKILYKARHMLSKIMLERILVQSSDDKTKFWINSVILFLLLL